MIRPFQTGVATLLTLAVAATMTVGAFAQGTGIEGRGKKPEKHESNTLKKIGKAIQYPVRKASENVSVNAHRAVGRNSVRKDTRKGRTYIVAPVGKKVSMRSPRNNHRRRVVTHHAKRRHTGHRMYRRHH